MQGFSYVLTVFKTFAMWTHPSEPSERHNMKREPLAPIFLLLLLLTACALQVAPSGGPEDKTPPEVIATFPKQGAAHVPLDAGVIFEFSEKIDRETFPKAVYVSPKPGGELEFDFKRRRTEIRFPGPLLPDRTYVVTLGTDLRDYHGVPLANSFTVAFSTGDSIDQGQIAGRVFDPKAQGISIWAYILPNGADSTVQIDPRRESGDYITQTGASGEFRISFISPGWYRVFAVRDQFRNGVYEPGEDEIGVAEHDVRISNDSTKIAYLRFRITREDTLAPALAAASMANNAVLEVRFDDVITAEDTTWTRHFLLFDSTAHDTLDIEAVTRFPLDGKLFFMKIAPVSGALDLHLEVQGVTDRAGNPLDTAFASIDFAANPLPNTVRPAILRFTPADSARNILLDEPIRVIFTNWMHQPDSAIGLTVTSPSNEAIPGKLQWQNPFELTFMPQGKWPSFAEVRVRLDTTVLVDHAGNALFDTLGTRIFFTVKKDTFAAIAGTVIDKRGGDSVPVHLTAKQVVGGDAQYRLLLPQPGAYRFDEVMPGVYLIEGFFDRNRNGRYDFGQPIPFQPAERFFNYADSIKVRSRWPNVGNDIVVE